MEAYSNLQAKRNGPPVNFVTRKPIGGLDVNQMTKLPPRDGPIGTVDGRVDIMVIDRNNKLKFSA